MKELSLHILDIFENAVRAGAKNITLDIKIERDNDWMTISIEDNGEGMDRQTLEKALSPFFTTKTVRNVGMGIPLFKAAAERAGGTFQITSRRGRGTKIIAQFQWSHIDRQPLGDISFAITTILMSHPDLDVMYTFRDESINYRFDSREVKNILGEVSISAPEVIQFIRQMIRERQSLSDESINE